MVAAAEPVLTRPLRGQIKLRPLPDRPRVGPDHRREQCTVVPFATSRPSKVKSSSASRVTQVVVGLSLITSSTAAGASSGFARQELPLVRLLEE